MLDMGFREDLERLLQATPSTRRTLLFSATIPKDIAAMAKRFQRDAKRIATTSERDRHADIAYAAVVITPRERDLAVVNLLRYHEAPGAIVFCATRDGVTHLAANLAERGFSVAALSGELSQRERNMALQALRDGRARVCVATDVAARGLDLPDLGIVIHADLPQNKEVLVHRSGRTGRAGRKGVAILIVPDPARRFAERLFHAAHIDAAWSTAPTADAIRVRDQAQLAVEVRAMTAEPTDEDREVARTLLTEHSAEALVAALVHQRRQLLPAPEELSVPRSMTAAPRGRESREEVPARGRTDRFATAAPRGRESPHGEEVPARGRPARSTPAPRARKDSHERMVWFTINVGRSKNADPKWIVPLLCRRGHIGKQDIGKIQVLARETRVEISAEASERFAAAVRVPDAKDRNVHIEPVDEAIE
jgi:ATP-dependent RNA helicase DeaD